MKTWKKYWFSNQARTMCCWCFWTMKNYIGSRTYRAYRTSSVYITTRFRWSLYWQPQMPRMPHMKILHHEDAATWHIKMSTLSKQISLLHTPNVNKLWFERASREGGWQNNKSRFYLRLPHIELHIKFWLGWPDSAIRPQQLMFFELWAAIVAAAHTAPTAHQAFT